MQNGVVQVADGVQIIYGAKADIYKNNLKSALEHGLIFQCRSGFRIKARASANGRCPFLHTKIKLCGTAVEDLIEPGKEGDGGDGGARMSLTGSGRNMPNTASGRTCGRMEDEGINRMILRRQASSKLTLACPSAIKSFAGRVSAKMPAM